MALFLNGKQVRGSLIVEGDLTMPLPTVDTASGSIATFDTDLTENLIECVCEIQYSQAEGTPTPDNPIPIQVFDSLTLYHNDINMWDEQWEVGGYNTTTGEKTTATNRIRNKNYIHVVSGDTYFVASSDTIRIFYYDINKLFITSEAVYANNTFTIPSGVYFINFQVAGTYGTTYNNDISINYPSTDTEYHAFNGAYIPFGQTVAKGTLDVLSGKLTIDFGSVDMGSLSWTFSSNHFWATFYDVKENTPNLFSSMYIFNNSAITLMPDYSFKYIKSTTRFIVKNSDYTDANAFKTAMTGVPIVYELEQPLVVQLNSNQVQALLNENNIWCDTNGDTRVKFLLTVGKKIA